MSKIESLRRNVDKIDSEIVKLLTNRMIIYKTIAKEKGRLGLPIRIPSREKEVMKKALKAAERGGLDKNFVKSLFKRILNQSRSEQRRLLK